MKKNYRIALILLSLFLMGGYLPISAYALLVRTSVDSTFVVVDDVKNVQWADINRFLNYNFEEVLDEISTMNSAVFAGAVDWHLASLSEVTQLFDQFNTVGDARKFDPTVVTSVIEAFSGRFDHINYPFPGDGSHAGASIEYHPSEPNNSTEFISSLLHNYNDSVRFAFTGAFVVSSATVQPIPEPTTILLSGLGLLGIGAYIRRRKNN